LTSNVAPKRGCSAPLNALRLLPVLMKSSMLTPPLASDWA
jgi:hypothetical protein